MRSATGSGAQRTIRWRIPGALNKMASARSQDHSPSSEANLRVLWPYPIDKRLPISPLLPATMRVGSFGPSEASKLSIPTFVLHKFLLPLRAFFHLRVEYGRS